MRQEIRHIIQLLILFFKGFFTLKNKIFLFSIPTHSNMGDQAQLMCTEKWIGANFKEYKLLELPHLCVPFNIKDPKTMIFNTQFIQYLVLSMIIRKKDIFIGHSGYFFVDHHGGWFSYSFLLQHWNNRFIILPQTINFHTPYVKVLVSKIFGNRSNLTIMCRDEVSFSKAKELFGSTKLLLYPDIVTSLIGTRVYNNKRNGVLFCIRADIEALYRPEDIENLRNKFGNIRTEIIDTTLKLSKSEIKLKRDLLINEMIDKISTFEVTITDRYHGTIFSAIANTPVVVINSTDHKLSSGVNWFPKDIFGNNVQFANSLGEAYDMAMCILRSKTIVKNQPYFKDVYWDKLSSKI